MLVEATDERNPRAVPPDNFMPNGPDVLRMSHENRGQTALKPLDSHRDEEHDLHRARCVINSLSTGGKQEGGSAMDRTTDQSQQYRERLGFWLRMARESAPRDDEFGRLGYSQREAAVALGMSEKSASSLVDWERGVRAPSLEVVSRMAVLYDVPVNVFTEPMPTAYERLEEARRVRELPEPEAEAEAEFLPDINALITTQWAQQLEALNRAIADLNAAAPLTVAEHLSEQSKTVREVLERVYQPTSRSSPRSE
jgi:transcriptional regulator with XRE-family HTH domain